MRHPTQWASGKQRAIDVISAMPEDVSLADVIERLRLIAKIDEGIHQADAGLLTDHEEVKKRFCPEVLP